MLQTMRNIVFAFSLCLLSAQAQFDYTTNNGTVTITSYTGPGGSVTIPDTINGLPVTSIGDYAFYWRTSLGVTLTSITIPGSVTSIGVYTFAQNYPNLTGVYFMGNAPPHVDAAAFNTVISGYTNPCNVTVCYFPGTTGWGLTLGGRPTVCWNVQVTEPVVAAGGFRFTVTGNSNLVVAVEASTDLSTWSRLHIIPLTGEVYSGAFYYLDGDWTNYPARFYRLRWP
jgi:hypothetical protein